jgi:rubrerythrin
MAKTHEVRPMGSLAELLAVGEAMERESAARYRELAARMAAAGNAEVAALFRKLELAERGHEEGIARRAAALGLPPGAGSVAWETGEVFAPDDMADEDPYTLGAYRALSIAVHNEERAFAFYAYAAAHAPDEEVRRVAEELAQEELDHAAILRRERRKAWRRHRPIAVPVPTPPRDLDELRTVVAGLEGGLAARHRARADAARSAGDAASAEALQEAAATAEALLSEAHPAAPRAAVEPPAGARARELLRACLADLEGAYDFYMRTAEAAGSEAVMREAQRLAETTIRRTATIRARLVALGPAAGAAQV